MFIGVEFFAEYSKTYTYICKKRNVTKGDFVIVPTPTGSTVGKVTHTKLAIPSYQCKEVIRKVRL